ncbi:MAG: site-2 protease family protein [Candidatus Limnocylindrales bacterium]
MNFDPVTLLPRLFAVAMILLISFPVHEFAHALAAYRLGDGTAKLFGRLTLNPIAHFDPLGGLLLVVSSLSGFGIGWAKPTPVNPANLRGGRDSEGIVAFAGPASNLVLAALAAIPLRLLIAAADGGTAVPPVILNALAFFILINVALMIFNLVPIPPLDGSKVLFSMLSPRQVWQWRPVLEQYGFLILILVAFVPILPGGETVFGFIFIKIGIPIVNILVGRPIFG